MVQPNKKPTILLATNHSYMFYRFRKELIMALRCHFEIILATPFCGHEDDLKALGIALLPVKMDRRSINPVKDLQLVRDYEDLLKQVKPDLVLTFSIKPNVYLGMLCARHNIPYCSHVQGLGTAFQKPGMKQIAAMLYRQGLRKAKAVFFENQVNLDFFVQNKIARADQCVKLNGAGISLKEYPRRPYPHNDVIRLLYLGRIMKEKGIDELLAALESIHEKNVPFCLHIAGFCEDDYTDRLSQLEKEGWIAQHGFVEDPRPLYWNSDVVILPSWHEGMSNVLLEAAASGRPLITTDIPGCREAVDQGRSGILVPAQNPSALQEAIEEMMNLSFEQREAMGIAGREKMEKEFARDVVVKTTVEVLLGSFQR